VGAGDIGRSMKLIIYNETPLSDAEAMVYISAVMKQGLISNHGKSYCYATVFRNGENKVCVFANRISETTHKFYVIFD
jgi:hypothetical protein